MDYTSTTCMKMSDCMTLEKLQCLRSSIQSVRFIHFVTKAKWQFGKKKYCRLLIVDYFPSRFIVDTNALWIMLKLLWNCLQMDELYSNWNILSFEKRKSCAFCEYFSRGSTSITWSDPPYCKNDGEQISFARARATHKCAFGNNVE